MADRSSVSLGFVRLRRTCTLAAPYPNPTMHSREATEAHMYTGRTLVQFTSRSFSSDSVSSLPWGARPAAALRLSGNIDTPPCPAKPGLVTQPAPMRGPGHEDACICTLWTWRHGPSRSQASRRAAHLVPGLRVAGVLLAVGHLVRLPPPQARRQRQRARSARGRRTRARAARKAGPAPRRHLQVHGNPTPTLTAAHLQVHAGGRAEDVLLQVRQRVQNRRALGRLAPVHVVHNCAPRRPQRSARGGGGHAGHLLLCSCCGTAK
jgi:hypothetical protein